ncbi:MAG: hypothetical protein AAB731_01250 [Patescibacteria group bacterium]
MLNKLALHCEALHRRQVHLAVVGIAVAASVGLYFVLPVLLLAEEIAMSTPVIHRFKVAYAQDYVAPTTQQQPVEQPQQMVPQTQPVYPMQQQPTQQPMQQQPPQQTQQVYPMPPGVTCQKGEVYTKNDQGKITCVRMDNSAGGQMGPQGQQMGPPQGQQMDTKEQQMGPWGEAPEMQEEFVDPREIKNAQRDAARMKAELKRFSAKLKKLPNAAEDVQKINDILAKIAEFEKNLKNPTEEMSIRDILRDFYENNYWDQVNQFRARIELPNEIKNYTKELTRVAKLVTNKSFAKLGFDMAILKGRLYEMKAAMADVQAKYNAGDFEDAMEAMNDVRETGHPGEVQGVMYQVRDIMQRVKALRSKDIQAQIQEIIQPIIDSFNEGDFREANMALQEVTGVLRKMQSKILRMNVADDATNEKFERLQQLIEEKLGNKQGAESRSEKESKPAPMNEPG